MGCVSSKEVKLEPQSTAEDKFLVDHHQQVVHTTGSNELRDFAVSHPPARETPIVDQGNEQPAVASNTLAAWVSEEKMQDLELISFELIQKLDVKQGGSITAETFHNLESSAFTEYQDKMTAFLDEAVKEYDGKLDDKSVKVVKETANGHDMLQVTAPVENCINDLITGIGLVADLHPLLKISWFIVSVGYRIGKVGSEIGAQFQTFVEHLAEASRQIDRLKNLPATGIPEETRKLFAGCIDSYIACLIDVVNLFLEYIAKKDSLEARSVSDTFGNDDQRLKYINDRIELAANNMQRIKENSFIFFDNRALSPEASRVVLNQLARIVNNLEEDQQKEVNLKKDEKETAEKKEEKKTE